MVEHDASKHTRRRASGKGYQPGRSVIAMMGAELGLWGSTDNHESEPPARNRNRNVTRTARPTPPTPEPVPNPPEEPTPAGTSPKGNDCGVFWSDVSPTAAEATPT